MEQAVKMYVLITIGVTCMLIMLTVSVSFNKTGHAFANDAIIKCEAQTNADETLCVFSGTEETCNIRFPNGYDICDGAEMINGKIYNLTSAE